MPDLIQYPGKHPDYPYRVIQYYRRRSQPKPDEKPKPVLYPKQKMLRERLLDAAFLFIMKKLTIFILILLLLIVSEYFLLNELLSHSIRISILLLSLLSTIIFIFVIVRFFKKYILPTKHS
jgi:hypothetical protein